MKKLTRRGFVKKVAQSLSKVAMCALAVVLLSPNCVYAEDMKWLNEVYHSQSGKYTWTLPVTEENSARERGYVYNTTPGDSEHWKPLTGDAGAGYHWYTGNVPKDEFIYVSKWKLSYPDHTCCHHGYKNNTSLYGVSWSRGSCAEREKVQKLSSGWTATCAHCGKELPYYFYTTDDKIKSVNKLRAGSFYYSKCSVCNNLEQGILVDHECKAKSINRFYVHYDGNGATGGAMKDSMHYVDPQSDKVTYEGVLVNNNKNGTTIGFSKKGYTFEGWALSKSGSVVLGNEFTLADLLGKISSPSDGQVITVYAKWVANSSFGSLKVNPNGGAYYGDGSTRVVATGMKGQTYTVNAGQIAPPTGYTVSFNAAEGRSDAASRSSNFVFKGISFSGKGKVDNLTYTFPSVTNNDTITFQWRRDAIILPNATRGNYKFAGWYNGSNFVGRAGDSFYPSENTTLTAHWESEAPIVLYIATTTGDWRGDATDAIANARWNAIGDNGQFSYHMQYMEYVGSVEYTTLNTSGLAANAVGTTKVTAGNEDEYTIPQSGIYECTVKGARGNQPASGKTGGNGDNIWVKTFFPKGTKLQLHAGKVGAGGAKGTYGYAGGDASFIRYNNTTLSGKYLVVAGGGGGAGNNTNGKKGGATFHTGQNDGVVGNYDTTGADGNSTNTGGGGGFGNIAGSAGTGKTGGNGGSSFIRGARVPDTANWRTRVQDNAAGGSVEIKPVDLTCVDNTVTSYNVMSIPDKACPDAVPDIVVTHNDDATGFSVTMGVPKDNGTPYRFRVRAWRYEGGTHAYVYSNTVSHITTTGVGGFYYLFDENAGTTITQALSSYVPWNGSSATVSPGTFAYSSFTRGRTYYLHVAAVDRQGNIGATSTVAIDIPPETYTISFNTDGGTAVSPNPLKVTLGSAAPNVPVSKKANCEFLGWAIGNDYIFDANGAPTRDGDYVSFDGKWKYPGNVTVTAKWKATEPNLIVTLRFYKNDGTPEYFDKTFVSNANGFGSYLLDNEMGWALEGYDLDGWTDNHGNSYNVKGELTNAQIVDYYNKSGYGANLVPIYAQWSPKTYQIAFDYHMPEGHALPGNAEMVRAVTYKGSVGVLPSPTTTGYTFKGWYKEDTYRTKVADNSTYDTPGDSLLHGKWEANTYTVRLWPNKPGTATGNVSFLAPAGWTNKGDHYEAVFTYDKSSTLPNPADVYSLYGWSCTGWYRTAAGGNLIGSGTKAWNLTGSGYVDLYPVWSAAVYTITLNPFDATEPGTTVIYEKYDTGFYSDSACTKLITSITPPKKTNFSPEGYYTQSLKEGTQMISAAGQFTGNMKPNVFGGNAVLIEK